MHLVQRFKDYLSRGGWWSEDLEKKGLHLQRDGARAWNWIFGFGLAAVLLMMFAKRPDADHLVYDLIDPTRDKAPMLSDKKWEDLHPTPEYQGRAAGLKAKTATWNE